MGMTNLGNVFLRRAERQRFNQLLDQLAGGTSAGHPLSNAAGLPSAASPPATGSPTQAPVAGHPLAQGMNPQQLQMARMLGKYNPQMGAQYLAQMLTQGPPQAPQPDWEIKKGIDDHLYRVDKTGQFPPERAIPGAEAPPSTMKKDFDIVKGIDNKQYKVYHDGRPPEPAIPDAKAPEPEPSVKLPNFKDEQSLRKEWATESKTFNKTQDGMRRVLAASDRDSAAGDHALIFSYMKTQDPDSVVRESEFQIAQSLGSMPQVIRAYAQRVINGERLTPEQRQDIVETARAIYSDVAIQQQRKREQYMGIAQGYGLEPNRALIDYIDKDLLNIPEGDVGIGALTVSGKPLEQMTDEELKALAGG